LKAGYARLNIKNAPNEAAASANVNTTTSTMAGSYDLKVASIALSKQDRKDDAATALKTTSTMVSVIVPLAGQYRLMANTGYRKTDSSSTAALVDGKTTFTGIGAEYDLSKRTFVYARTQRGTAGDADMTKVVINGAVGANNAAQDRAYSLSVVGISHAF
jgi:predicted porin